MAAAYFDEGVINDQGYAGTPNNQNNLNNADVSDIDPKLLEFCTEYRLTSDILPLFIENHIDYDLLLFDLTSDDLTHLFKNEWKLKFIQIKRIENAIKKEKTKTDNKNNNNNNNNAESMLKLGQKQKEIDKIKLELSSTQHENEQLKLKISNLNDELIDLKDEIKQSKQANNKIRDLYNEQTRKIDDLNDTIKNLKIKLNNSSNNNNNNIENDSKTSVINEYDQMSNNSNGWQCGLCSHRNVSHASVCASCDSKAPRKRNNNTKNTQSSNVFGGGGTTHATAASAARARAAQAAQAQARAQQEREDEEMKELERALRERRLYEEKMKHSVESQFVCKCGTKLRKLVAFRAYGSASGVVCNVCGETASALSEVYHCPKMKVLEHIQGFDMCEDCAQQKLEEHRRRQIGNSGIDKDMLLLLNALLKD